MTKQSVIGNRASTLRSGHALQTGTFRHATEDGSKICHWTDCNDCAESAAILDSRCPMSDFKISDLSIAWTTSNTPSASCKTPGPWMKTPNAKLQTPKNL